MGIKKLSNQYKALQSKWMNNRHEYQKTTELKHGSILTGFLKSLHNPKLNNDKIPKGQDLMNKTEAQPFTKHQNVLIKDLIHLKLFINLYQKQSNRKFSVIDEARIIDILSSNFSISLKAEINKIRLKSNMSLIRKLQHLRRYPNDNIKDHDIALRGHSEPLDTSQTLGLSVWGYFANSKESLTNLQLLLEKWYIAINSLSIPNWNIHQAEYGIFLKYRKMIIFNPENGLAAVACISNLYWDAENTHEIGGSEELINYLKLNDKNNKAQVLYFFVNENSDDVSLGPIKLTVN